MIFEPLQNVQMSQSKFQVTYFIDFQTYLDYFHGYKGYLDKFMHSILKVPKQLLYQRFMRDKGGDINMHPDTCDQPPRCRAPLKPTMRHLTLKGGAIESGKIMSLCVEIGIYIHVWYSASLIGY